MTDMLSGEKYVTVSVVKPLMNHIFTNVLLHNEEDTALSKEKTRKKEKLTFCFENDRFQTFTILSLCSFLDPQFKLSSSSVICTEDQSDSSDSIILTRVKEEMAVFGEHSQNSECQGSISASDDHGGLDSLQSAQENH